MLKRKIGIIAVCLLSCLLIVGCGNKDQGGFQDVEVSKEQPTERETIFKQAKDTLGYEYKTVQNGRTEVAFDIPKDWEVEIENGRHISMQAPENDPHLPGMSLHYYTNLQIPKNNENLQIIGEYDKFFNRDMEITKYNFHGKDYCLYGEFMPEEMDTDTSITPGTDKLTSIAYNSYPTLLTYTIDPLGEDVAIFAYYVKWYNEPTLFTCAFPDEKKETAEALLRYVVSSMRKYYPPEPQYQEVKIDGIKLNLPTDFIELSDNAYAVPLSNPSQHCGFAVAVYDVDEQTKETLPFEVDEIAADVVSRVAGTSVYAHHEPMHSPGREAKEIAGTSHLKMHCYTVFRAIPYNYESTSMWNDYYNGSPTLYTTYYYCSNRGKDKLITFTWATDQMEEAFKIEENIEISIKNGI